MKAFAHLFAELDATTSTAAKVAALVRYFAQARSEDAAWAVYFLAGGKPRQVVPTATLRTLASQRACVDDWLFEECYQAVGDLAETIALVLPPAARVSALPLALWVEERLLTLRGVARELQAERIACYWDELATPERFLLTKLIGGGFRVGVSKLLVQRALAEHAGLDAKVVAQRMMGYTDAKTSPNATRYAQLIEPGHSARTDAGQPYPFFLAHAIDGAAETFAERLGPPSDWLVEWKYDGIRAQLVRRGGQTWLWSRGEELVTDRFPEVVTLAAALPDGCVLDGEVLAWVDDRPAPFNLLQQRIVRKTLSKKVLAAAPVNFIAYDLLEWQGEDVRHLPQRTRREWLERAARNAGLLLSPLVDAGDWPTLATLREGSRARGVEGFMLKHAQSAYGSGRTKATGSWWKWKIDPLTIDCVLIYAQAGHGRRASVFTDYTFALWNRAPQDAAEAQAVVEAIARRAPGAEGALQLVAFAKAYSGLSDEEFKAIDRAIRQTTLEKFGPVRSVRPTLVFELGFEGLARSTRHKSGIAVRFPRMLRIRSDKRIEEADTLQTLQALLTGA